MKVILDLELEIDGHYNIEDVEDYYAFKYGLTKSLPKNNALANEKHLYSDVTNINVLQHEDDVEYYG